MRATQRRNGVKERACDQRSPCHTPPRFVFERLLSNNAERRTRRPSIPREIKRREETRPHRWWRWRRTMKRRKCLQFRCCIPRAWFSTPPFRYLRHRHIYTAKTRNFPLSFPSFSFFSLSFFSALQNDYRCVITAAVSFPRFSHRSIALLQPRSPPTDPLQV